MIPLSRQERFEVAPHQKPHPIHLGVKATNKNASDRGNGTNLTKYETIWRIHLHRSNIHLLPVNPSVKIKLLTEKAKTY